MESEKSVSKTNENTIIRLATLAKSNIQEITIETTDIILKWFVFFSSGIIKNKILIPPKCKNIANTTKKCFFKTIA